MKNRKTKIEMLTLSIQDININEKWLQAIRIYRHTLIHNSIIPK